MKVPFAGLTLQEYAEAVSAWENHMTGADLTIPSNPVSEWIGDISTFDLQLWEIDTDELLIEEV